MVVTCQEMQEAESRLFATGADAEPLMDKAGRGCAESIRKVFPRPGIATLFCGRGNNGGDALVAGTWLRKWGWTVTSRFSHPLEEMSDLARKKFREFQSTENTADPGSGVPRVLVDGLLGIGARGALRGAIGELADQLNRQRIAEHAISFAIDIPSGVDGDNGEIYPGAVVADHTLTICVPKRGLVADAAIDHVGRLHVIPLPEIPCDTGDATLEVLSRATLLPRLPRRRFDTHKGDAGRVGIVAGSPGFTGAAVLSALGALHGGAGLVTVFVPPPVYEIVATRAPVEVMVRPFDSIGDILAVKTDVIAAGPGMGTEVAPELVEFAASHAGSMVLDADMLNALSRHPEMLTRFPPERRILTPHPGELARLADDLSGDRIDDTRNLAERWGVTLLHKGARTVVASPGNPTGINSTGHPGMASGGMGDVLTGLSAALAGQGMRLHDAACLGSWLLGRAAELSAPSITASRVAEAIGRAMEDLVAG